MKELQRNGLKNDPFRCHISPQFSTGQRYIYTGCAAGRVVIYDLLTGKITKVKKFHVSINSNRVSIIVHQNAHTTQVLFINATEFKILFLSRFYPATKAV
jgi:hypothetical protein